MSNEPTKGPIIFHTVINATTVGPGFVPSAITTSQAYAVKTKWVVLEKSDGSNVAHIFRKSSTSPNQYSEDLHDWAGRKWKRRGKAKRKYSESELPSPPAGAIRELVEGVDVWTMSQLSELERDKLRVLISTLSRERG